MNCLSSEVGPLKIDIAISRFLWYFEIRSEFLKTNKNHKKGERIMPVKLENVTLEMIERVFWMRAQRGYAVDIPAKKDAFPLLPGWSGFYIPLGDYVYFDAYCVNAVSRRSVGFTQIYIRNYSNELSEPHKILLWMMNYGGCYKKEAIPFLKLALRSAIEKRVFLGGRGEHYFVNKKYPSLYYHNHLHVNQEFLEFSGREEILYDGTPTCQCHRNLGYHWYNGMSLVGL